VSRREQIAALVARVQDGLEAARELAELVGTSERRERIPVLISDTPVSDLDAAFAERELARVGVTVSRKR